MFCNIYINYDKVIFINGSNQSMIFSLDSLDMFSVMASELKVSRGVVANFSICRENVIRFIFIYKKLKKFMLSDFLVIIDISNLDDNDIKKNEKILEYLELELNCSFQYRYDSYATSSIGEILNAIDFVERQVQIIRHYQLSPLEILMFVYDKVRDKKYSRETSLESLDVSRNLSKVIGGNSIVCAGFANLARAILNKVGIYTENIYWKNKNFLSHGHVSNISYINDLKYDIHGIFEMDATKGCKKDNNSASTFQSYFYFANSLDRVFGKNLDNGLIYNDNYNNLFYKVRKQYEKYCNIFDNASSIVVNFQGLLLVKELKKIFLLLGIDIIKLDVIISDIQNLENKNVIKDKIDKMFANDGIIKSLFHSNIDYSDFMNILYQVRRVEHSIDPDKFLFSGEDMYQIIKRFYFSCDNRELFYLSLFINVFDDVDVDVLKDDIISIGENLIKKDALRMKLISVLRKRGK